MKINSILLAASISIIALSSPVFASQEAGDQAMANCRSQAASDEIPANELNDYIKQCMENSGSSQDGVNMSNDQNESEGNSAPATESSD